jgi:hypothetical protein
VLQTRITGRYETNTFLADERRRQTEARMWASEIFRSSEVRHDHHPSTVPPGAGKLLGCIRGATRAQKAPGQTKKPSPTSSTMKNLTSVARIAYLMNRSGQELSFGDETLDDEHDEAKTTRGFNKQWVELVIGMSFFPNERISRIAANDFLTNPSLMVPCYLEWASACEHLAASGVLNASANAGIVSLAQTLWQCPAACLDYFDAAYTRKDADGEYAGFTLCGHILNNEAVFGWESVEQAIKMPSTLTEPLGAIHVAVKHNQRNFLAQEASPPHRDVTP